MSKVTWNSAALLARARVGAWRGVTEWIGLVERRAVELITSPPKTGRIYKRRGVTHQASAPGEAPANDTSRLLNSRRIDLFESQLRARLTFSAKHALPLEAGTMKMEPRPFARRALRETDAEGVALVERRVQEALG